MWFARGERNWEKGKGDDPFWNYPLEELRKIERDKSLDWRIRERAKRVRKQREKKGK